MKAKTMNRNKILVSILCFCLASNLYAEQETQKYNSNNLTLKTALEKAVTSNPSLLSLMKLEEKNEGLVKQAKVSPSPSLIIGAEDFAGNGEYKKTSSMKSTIGLSQTIETAGKRKNRIRIADSTKNAEILKVEIAKKEMKLKVATLFFKLYQLTKELEIQKESIELARQTSDSVNKRVAAGELAQIDSTRAYVEFTREETLRKHLELDITSLKNEIATLLGEKSFDYDGIKVDVQSFIKEELSAPEKINIEELPEIALAKAELKLAESEYNMTKAEKVSDVELTVNYSKYRATSDHAFAIEASVPLARNSVKGKMQSAKAEVEAAKLGLTSVNSELSAKIYTAFQEKESLTKEVYNLENMLLPAAKEAYEQVQTAFNSGEKSLLDLFDAKKSLLATELLHLELECKLFNAISEYAILTNQM